MLLYSQLVFITGKDTPYSQAREKAYEKEFREVPDAELPCFLSVDSGMCYCVTFQNEGVRLYTGYYQLGKL